MPLPTFISAHQLAALMRLSCASGGRPTSRRLGRGRCALSHSCSSAQAAHRVTARMANMRSNASTSSGRIHCSYSRVFCAEDKWTLRWAVLVRYVTWRKERSLQLALQSWTWRRASQWNRRASVCTLWRASRVRRCRTQPRSRIYMGGVTSPCWIRPVRF